MRYVYVSVSVQHAPCFSACCSPAAEVFLAISAAGQASYAVLGSQGNTKTRGPSVHYDACLDPGRAPWWCSEHSTSLGWHQESDGLFFRKQPLSPGSHKEIGIQQQHSSSSAVHRPPCFTLSFVPVVTVYVCVVGWSPERGRTTKTFSRPVQRSNTHHGPHTGNTKHTATSAKTVPGSS